VRGDFRVSPNLRKAGREGGREEGREEGFESEPQPEKIATRKKRGKITLAFNFIPSLPPSLPSFPYLPPSLLLSAAAAGAAGRPHAWRDGGETQGRRACSEGGEGGRKGGREGGREGGEAVYMKLF